MSAGHARVGVVESVLGESHEGGVLLDEQDELRVAAHLPIVGKEEAVAILGKQQDELRVAAYLPYQERKGGGCHLRQGAGGLCVGSHVGHSVDGRRDGLAAHSHLGAVDRVAVVLEGDPPLRQVRLQGEVR